MNAGTIMSRSGWTLVALLCAAVGLVSLRYGLPSQPGASTNVAANPFASPWLPLHAVFGASALMLGPWQFWRGLRLRRPRVHRLTGRAYVGAAAVAAPAGLMLALGSTAGPVATAGFGLLALAWGYATAQGWRTAVDRRFDEHRRWMIRSFALCFSAVTLRLQLPISALAGIEMVDAYRAIAWLCWVPNLIAAELYLMRPAARPLMERRV